MWYAFGTVDKNVGAHTFIFPAGTEESGGAGGSSGDSFREGAEGAGGTDGQDSVGVDVSLSDAKDESDQPKPEDDSDPSASAALGQPDLAAQPVIHDDELLSMVSNLVSSHEGRRSHVYLDSLGHPTIGIGFNLDRGGAHDTLAAVGANYTAVREGSEDLSDEQIDTIFSRDLAAALAASRRQVSNFDTLHSNAKQVVLDMMFMGETKFSQFRRLIAALQAYDYESAAQEIISSRWFTQVGLRGPKDVALMRAATNPE